MKSTSRLRSWLPLSVTILVGGVLLGLLPRSQPSLDPLAAQANSAEKEPPHAWPLLGGNVQRNAVNLIDRNIATDWVVPKSADEKGKNIKWVVALGAKAYGGPVISGGKIFIGTNNQRQRNKDIKGDKGILMCFRESDGEFLWQSVHDKLPSGRVNDWPEEGVASHPVVEGNRLWYVSNRCEVICATTEGLKAGNVGVKDEKYRSKMDADIVWRVDMMKDLGVFPHNLATSSPLIVGDMLFLLTSNGVDEGHINIPAPDAPSFLALAKHTGKILWQDKSPGRNIMHAQWSSPVYANVKGEGQIIFPGGDGWIYSFKPQSGELIWKFNCNPRSAKYVLGGRGTKNDFVAGPVIWENKLYIGVGQDPEHKKGVGHLWCIDITRKPTSKDKDLSPYSDPKDNNPKFEPRDPRNKDSGLVWHFGGLNPNDEDREWHFGRTLSSCVIHEGLCYAADFDGMVFCLDARTGKKWWEYEMEADTWSSPYLVDGHVYMGDERGTIHIFEHNKTLKLVNKISMGKWAKVRRGPIACNGVLYVVTENPCRLWAIAK